MFKMMLGKNPDMLFLISKKQMMQMAECVCTILNVIHFDMEVVFRIEELNRFVLTACYYFSEVFTDKGQKEVNRWD